MGAEQLHAIGGLTLAIMYANDRHRQIMCPNADVEFQCAVNAFTRALSSLLPGQGDKQLFLFIWSGPTKNMRKGMQNTSKLQGLRRRQ